MAKATTIDSDFHRHERVVANLDMVGIPAGTPGKVILVDGFSWLRYRVLFDNGVDRGTLDPRFLVRPKDFIPVDQRVEEEVAAPGAESGGDDGDAPTAAGDASGDRGGVPAHLLERSKKARERLTAAS
jgi:hypothetical protein